MLHKKISNAGFTTWNVECFVFHFIKICMQSIFYMKYGILYILDENLGSDFLTLNMGYSAFHTWTSRYCFA